MYLYNHYPGGLIWFWGINPGGGKFGGIFYPGYGGIIIPGNAGPPGGIIIPGLIPPYAPIGGIFP